jgi:hypothetical protein
MKVGKIGFFLNTTNYDKFFCDNTTNFLIFILFAFNKYFHLFLGGDLGLLQGIRNGWKRFLVGQECDENKKGVRGKAKASGRDVMNIICYMSESSSTREALIVATGVEPQMRLRNKRVTTSAGSVVMFPLIH